MLKFLAIILLLTSCLGQLNRLFIGDATNVVLYANDVLMGLLAVAYVAYVLIIRRSWRIPISLAWLAAFLVVAGMSLLLGSAVLDHSQLLTSAFYPLRFASYAVMAFIVFDSVSYPVVALDRQKQLILWIIVLLGSAVLMAIGGFVQLLILPDLSGLAKYGWDPHYNRLVTAMLDPNYAGTYLSMGVALALSVLLATKNRMVQLFLVVVTTILILAILLTYSRSGYLMLAVILGVIAFLRAKWLLVVGAVVGIVVIVTVPRIQTRIQGAINPDASASLRVVSWQNSLSIAQTHPWLGVGFNSYRYAQDRYGIVVLGENVNAGAGADSSWLFIFATTGVLGLTIFCLFYFTLIWESWQAFILAGTELERSIGLASLAVLCGLVPASQFNNALFYTWILMWWMALIGLMLGVKYVTHLGTRTD